MHAVFRRLIYIPSKNFLLSIILHEVIPRFPVPSHSHLTGGSYSSDMAPKPISISPVSKCIPQWNQPRSHWERSGQCRHQLSFGIRQTWAWFLASTFISHEFLGMLPNPSRPQCPYVYILAQEPSLNCVCPLSWLWLKCLHTERVQSMIFILSLHCVYNPPLFWTLGTFNGSEHGLWGQTPWFSHWLCGLRQVSSLLCLSIKWGYKRVLTRRTVVHED